MHVCQYALIAILCAGLDASTAPQRICNAFGSLGGDAPRGGGRPGEGQSAPRSVGLTCAEDECPTPNLQESRPELEGEASHHGKGRLGHLLRFVLGSLQDAPAGSEGISESPHSTESAAPASDLVRFNFKGATFQQVIDFFARASGRPVIWESEAPEGTLDYISPEAYEPEEALRVLNIILQSKGVMLRVSNEMLYLQKLSEMQRENIPTHVGTLPAEITDDQIVTVVRPLNIALAKPLAEKLAAMVAEYGSVTPMEQQNALVITETAAQVRRLIRIIEELDREDPEGVVEIIPIRYAEASALMEPLKSLLAQKVEKYVINQQGQQVKIEEEQMAGLNISLDERTNSIIAKGTQSRIDNLKQAVQLLDVPVASSGRAIQTFALTQIAPAEAAGTLQRLYEKMPEDQRPTLITLEDFGRITVIGSTSAIEEATRVLTEIDGAAAAGGPSAAQMIAAFTLEKAGPDVIVEALRNLLNHRQQTLLRIAAGPDGRSIIVAGPSADVQAVEALLPVLDQAQRSAKQVRLLQIRSEDAPATVQRSRELYDRQVDSSGLAEDRASQLITELDQESGTLTLIGAPSAIERFSELLRSVESSRVVERETRPITVEHAEPSELAPALTALSDHLLPQQDQTRYVEPEIEPFDSLNLLIVTAQPEQFSVIAPLVAALDRVKPTTMPPLRILQLWSADAQNLADTLTRKYEQRPGEEREQRPVSVTADTQTNTLLVAAHADLLTEIQAIVDDLNDISGIEHEGREIRIFPLQFTRAEDLAGTLEEMFPGPPSPVDGRGRPLSPRRSAQQVVVRADGRTNSIIVGASTPRMAVFQQLVEQLDREQISGEIEVHTYPVVHADLQALSETIRQLVGGGSLTPARQERIGAVTVTTEPVSRTLIVSGPAEMFPRLEEMLADLDIKRAGPATALRFFRLQSARADRVAPMLREVLVTRLAEDVPDAGHDLEALLNVTADPRTNTLILSAPESILPVAEQLIEQLDDSSARLADSVIRVRPLSFADAREVSESVSAALKSIISDETGEPTEVQLIAAASSNAIIMVGGESELKKVEALIEPLDARPAEDQMDAKTFRLAHLEARTIAPILQNVLVDQQANDPRLVMERIRRSRGQVDLPPTIQVESDPVTNVLIVSGPQRTMALAETLIAQLDQPDESERATYDTFTPSNADPVTLADSVQQVLTAGREGSRRSSLRLIAEPRSGSVLIIGRQEEVEQAKSMLAQRDEATMTPPPMDLKIVGLAHTDADVVARTIAPLLVDQTRWPQPLRAVAQAGITIGQPTVTADATANRLLFSMPTALMPVAMALVKELDQPRSGSAVMDVHVLTLLQADASAVAEVLRTALDALAMVDPALPKAMVAAEPSSNAVIVTAAPAQLERVRTLVAELDSGYGADQPQVRTVFLKHARAETVTPIVEQLLAGEEIPVWLRFDWMRRSMPLPDAGPDVRVAADLRLNAVVISAPPAVLNIAEEMVAQLDVDPEVDARRRPAVHVLLVQNADAAQLAETIQDLFTEEQMPGDHPPTVRVDLASNTLLVRATPEQYAAIEKVVERVDRATIEVSRQMQLIPIDPARASAAEVAKALERMLNRSGGPSVEVMTLEDLLEETKEEEEPEGEGVSGVLDGGESNVQRSTFSVQPPGRMDSALSDVISLCRFAGSIPAPLESARDAAYLRRSTSSRHSPGGDRHEDNAFSSRLDAGYWTFNVGSSFCAQLDPVDSVTTRPNPPPRRGAFASLSPHLPARPGGSALARATMWVVLGAQDAEQESGGASADHFRSLLDATSDITIAVDEATNSLIVIGAPRAIDRVIQLARQLQEQIPAQAGQVRYIGLPAEVDSGALANLIDQTLRQLTAAGGERGALRQRTSVVADPVTNALVVAANDHDFALIGDLIAALARPPATEQVVVKFYPLATVTAERAAATVQQLIEPDGDPRRRGRQAERMRTLAVKLLAGEESIDAIFNPDRITVAVDQNANALMIAAPAEAIAFIDQFVELIDQSPVNVQATLKVYPLRHAQAEDLQRTLRQIFLARFRSVRDQPGVSAIQPEFAADGRTNTLLVTASPEQLTEVDSLLDQLDRDLGEALHELRIIELKAVSPSSTAGLLEQVVVGSDQARRAGTLIVADDGAGTLMVRASDEVNAEIDAVLAEIDRDATRQFEIRTVTVERANAEAVASALQRFFDDRARIASSGRGRRERGRQVSIIGDAASNTILVAASDDDFQTIEGLVGRFDAPEAVDALTFRVFQLQHAKATEIEETVQSLIGDLTWGQGPFFFFGGRFQGGTQRDSGTLAVRADARLNALIVTGEGDKFQVVEKIIEVLDAPPAEGDERVVRMYRPAQGNPQMVADIIRELFTDAAARRWWMPPDPREVKVRLDEASRTLVVSATAKEHEDIRALVESIESGISPAAQEMTVLPVEFAQAGDLARTLSRFLEDRARATGEPLSRPTIIASESANSLIVSAEAEELATIRDLLTRLDQPDVTGDRIIEIIALGDGDANEISRIIRDQFGRRGSAGQGVVVTPDVRTNSLIVNAPKVQSAQVRALIEELDAPGASDETIIRSYALEGAQAEEAVRILSETLQLDERGETSGITIKLDDEAPAVEVKARIVADPRSNSLLVTATAESFPVIESLVERLDKVPAARPVEYRIVTLQHIPADDVAFTLREVLRSRGRRTGAQESSGVEPSFDYNLLENQLIIAATADQFEQIRQIIDQLDRPSQRERITDFVPLKFAEAEKIQEALAVFYGRYAPEADTPGKRNVRIVADPATNSLVITADAEEWQDIRALLSELDAEEYDATLQLTVIPLTYADARSVAQAINEAFQGRLERDRSGRMPQPRSAAEEGERREVVTPTLLVEAEEWVRAAAEQQTNSVIVSASRQNSTKIQQIISQLDVADYAKLPAPKLISVTSGNPEQLAEALNRLYQPEGSGRGQRSLRIVGDQTSGTLIVRAEPEEFQQISALAQALQQEMDAGGLSVHVIHLRSAPARRIAEAIESAYRAKAERTNQPLSIEVDPVANSLIVASSGGLFDEIRRTVDELDALAPAAGQGIFIIELENISPDAAKSIIENIGLHEDARDDSVSRLVTEPVKVSVMPDRAAIIVIANPADRATIVSLLKAIDAEPALGQAHVRIVKLRNASAEAVGRLLSDVLNPAEQQAQTALARAVQEQVRRLSVHRDGLEEPPLNLDLTKPIRIVADPALNALLIGSTPDNVDALVELARTFDDVPITDAVTVQLFPLQNIAADQFARIVRDLFEQGKQLGAVPGTDLQAVPGGMVGRALVDELALSVDERTNTVIVAGKEDSVALVEALTQRLDSDVAVGWVEPRIIELRHADASDLAETLNAVLVEGAADLPGASPLQRQVARLRMARMQENGGQVLESEVFHPMTQLVIRPEPQLNALVVVGTPINIEVVSELVRMLDVQAASPSATVRVYPVENASASRLAAIITQLFDQQVESKAIRPEDRAIVQADERTNALIVTTSPRSFAVLESLLDTLDAAIAPDLREIRRIPLGHASAARLARLIQDLMDARLERLRKIQPETAELQRATIIADPRTNTLVVAAGNESFEVIERLARDLDTSSLTDLSLVQVVPLEKGNSDRIADTVNAVMERRYADLPDELRGAQQPLVLTDPRSNSLLVAANPEDMDAIRDLVFKLEAAPSHPAVALHVVALPDSVNSETLAPRLQRLMRERQQSLGESRRPSDNVSIEPDPLGNTLIVAASDENVEVIRELITVLVTAEEELVEGRTFDVLALSASRASDVVQLLGDLYVEEANRTRGEGTVQVTADDRLNAVLVNAPPSDMRTIRDLVAQLDGARPAAVVEIKYISLQSANALETVSLIENVLSGRGLGGRRTSQQATVLKYLREYAAEQSETEGMAPTEMDVSAAIRESITLTPDLRTNTIIVSAPAAAMEMIERMIRDLDMTSTGSKNIRIFKLTNADAETMARIITDLFNLRQGNSMFVLKPREPGEFSGETGDLTPGFGGLGTELTAVPDERQQLSITVDHRTNSLLVSGTPAYLDLVAQVVEELDSLEANEREIFVYQLRNARAEDVARVLSAFVDDELRKITATLSDEQLGSATRLLEREITIQGDELSNSVLVSASPRYLEIVQQMIRQLDIDPPQVLIQVMLAEVTLDSLDEWGVDFSAEGEIGSVNLAGGFGFASAFVTGMGVPNLSVASDDFELMLRAMRSQGRLQVLSNPSIMAANNQPARIQVGETIRVPTSTFLTEGGVQSTDVTEEELGIILQVTPSINPDGFVRMQVQPEISNLSQRTTQISEDFQSPVITIRTAQTVVTVKDGQTIVIGGLISDRFERRDRMVPVLGELPLIGPLFRSETEETTKTELLIVLTPHVIESPADYGRVQELTTGEIDRLTLPPEVKQGIREGIFDFSGGLYDAGGNPVEWNEVEPDQP